MHYIVMGASFWSIMKDVAKDVVHYFQGSEKYLCKKIMFNRVMEQLGGIGTS